MPFTFAHPVIVLPFLGQGPLPKKLGQWIHPGAIILGTMAPDFEYFINLRPKNDIGHSALGFLIYNLPLVVILYVILRMLVLPVALQVLPRFLSGRILSFMETWQGGRRAYRGGAWYAAPIFMGSAVFGMVTHVFWDAFTHVDGQMVQVIRGLSETFLGIKVYKWMQHGSTVLGIVIMIWLFWGVKLDSGSVNRISTLWPKQISLGFVVKVLSSLVGLWGISFALLNGIFTYHLKLELTLGAMVVMGIDSVMASILIGCAWIMVLNRQLFRLP